MDIGGRVDTQQQAVTDHQEHIMSPGVPSRIAELGGDPHRLSEAFHRLLVKAERAIEPRAEQRADEVAAVMQAIAVQTLATNVGRLVEAIEADNATGHLAFPPAPMAPAACCPRCGHERGFGRTCSSPDGGPHGPRCGCGNQFHTDGVR